MIGFTWLSELCIINYSIGLCGTLEDFMLYALLAVSLPPRTEKPPVVGSAALLPGLVELDD